MNLSPLPPLLHRKGRQDKVFYTSPTIRYAGLSFYAEPQDFSSRESEDEGEEKAKGKGKGKGKKKGGAGGGSGGGKSTPMQGQLVLQCRQKPGSFTMQRETMRFSSKWPKHTICPHTDSSQIEWLSKVRTAAIPHGESCNTKDHI